MPYRPFLLLAVLALPSSAITVTTVDDELDVPAGADISLREAIRNTPATNTVDFDSSLSGRTFELTLGKLTLISSLTIDASSLAVAPTINGLGADVILEFPGGNPITINSLNFTQGYYHRCRRKSHRRQRDRGRRVSRRPSRRNHCQPLGSTAPATR